MKAFDIDYKKLAVLLTPTFLRQSTFVAFVRALMQPMVTLYDKFSAQREDHLFNLAHNGQVCRLKHALNTLDDRLTYSNGFEIEDINALGDFVFAYDEDMPQSLWWWVADQPSYTMVYDEAEILVVTETFVVFVPDIFDFNGSKPADPRIISMVEQYRLVSRTATYRSKVYNPIN